MALTIADIVELAGEAAAEDVRQLTLRGQGVTSFAPFAPQLPSLEGLSLSHNQLATLDGLRLLANLVTLNVNNNLLPSLAGLESCYGLQQLYAANNRVRDLQPLAGLTQLHTLSCMRNAISSLDMALQVLSGLTCLTDLDLSANPLSTVPDSKHLLLQHVPSLQLLDGERVTDMDRQLAGEQQHTHGPWEQGALTSSHSSGPAEGPPDILVLDAGGDEVGQEVQGQGTASGETAAGGTGPCLAPQSSSGPAVAPWPTGQAGAAPRLATAALHPAGNGAARPGTASVRPGTASIRPGTASARPGTAGGYTQQLCSDPGLNDHPLLLEYLAKYVLAEGMAAAGQAQPAAAVGSRLRGSFAARLRTTATAMAGTELLKVNDLATNDAVQAALPASSGASAVQELLRDATPHELIRQLVRLAEILICQLEAARHGATGGPRPASAGCLPARPGSSGTHMSTSRDNATVAARPTSSGPATEARQLQAGQPGTTSTAAASGSAATVAPGSRVGSAGKAAPGALKPPAIWPPPQQQSPPSHAITTAPSSTSQSASSAAPMNNGAQGLAASPDQAPSPVDDEVVLLRRQVKQLELENHNMYWLADEYKRVKAELAELQAKVQ